MDTSSMPSVVCGGGIINANSINSHFRLAHQMNQVQEDPKKKFFLFSFANHTYIMSNFINSLLYGFTNILSVGPEQPREGQENEGGCGGSNGEGCCKDKPQEPKAKSDCCQGDNARDACCSSSAEPATAAAAAVETSKEDGCCQSTPGKSSCACESASNEPVVIDNLKIIFSTLTGTAKTMATEIENKINANERVTVNKIEVMDVTEYDNDNLLQETAVCVFILSTYNVEGPLDW